MNLFGEKSCTQRDLACYMKTWWDLFCGPGMEKKAYHPFENLATVCCLNMKSTSIGFVIVMKKQNFLCICYYSENWKILFARNQKLVPPVCVLNRLYRNKNIAYVSISEDW